MPKTRGQPGKGFSPPPREGDFFTQRSVGVSTSPPSGKFPQSFPTELRSPPSCVPVPSSPTSPFSPLESYFHFVSVLLTLSNRGAFYAGKAQPPRCRWDLPASSIFRTARSFHGPPVKTIGRITPSYNIFKPLHRNSNVAVSSCLRPCVPLTSLVFFFSTLWWGSPSSPKQGPGRRKFFGIRCCPLDFGEGVTHRGEGKGPF